MESCKYAVYCKKSKNDNTKLRENKKEGYASEYKVNKQKTKNKK